MILGTLKLISSPSGRSVSFKYDKSLKGEFVRLVQASDMDEDEKAKVIEIGIRAIMGEDI